MVPSTTRWFSLALKSCCDLGFFPPDINIAAALGFNNLRLPRVLSESFIFSPSTKGEVSAVTMAAQAASPRIQTAT